MDKLKVYYNSFFYSDEKISQEQTDGIEVPINKDFVWGADQWKVLSMYIFEEGPIFHICKRIKTEVLNNYYSKWSQLMQLTKEGRYDEVSMEQREMMRVDSPYEETPSISITINGQNIDSGYSMSDGWIPSCYDDEYECSKKMPHILSHYALEDSDGWLIIHLQCKWPEVPFNIKSISQIELTLEADSLTVPGPHFTVNEAGEEISFTRPSTGQQHILKVSTPEAVVFEDEDGSAHYVQFTYTVTPNLPDEVFSIKDCKEDGCAAILYCDDREDESVHTAFSDTHFDTTETIEWRMVFKEKVRQNFTLTLQEGRDFDITREEN